MPSYDHNAANNGTGTTPPVPDGAELRYAALSETPRRLFGRLAARYHAVASPFPRPRDQEGNTLNRLTLYDRAIPGKGQLNRTYGDAVSIIAKLRPMRGAILNDAIARVETAIERYHTLVLEEEESRQVFNEEAAEHQARVDKELADLRDGRSAIQHEQDKLVADRRDALALARMELAEQFAINNLPVSLRNWGAADDPEVTAKSPSLGDDAAFVSSETAAQTSARELVPAVQSRQIASGRRSLTERLAKLLPYGRSSAAASTSSSPNPPVVHSAPAPIVTTSEAWSANTSGPARFPEREQVREDFPVAEGRERARPESVIALDCGLPASTPSQAVFPQGRFFSAVALWLVNFACGSIFGISVGILLGLLSMTTLALGGRKMEEIATICIFFGICVFWGLGKTIQGLMSLAVEEHYTASLTLHADDRAQAGRWFRRVGFWTTGIMIGSFLLLVLIEANVEKSGIISLFLQNTANQAMLTGKVAYSPPSAFSIICLTLIASVPFALLHATEAWVQTRSRLLASRLSAGRDRDAWEASKELYERRLADKQETRDAKHKISMEDFETARKAADEERVEVASHRARESQRLRDDQNAASERGTGSTDRTQTSATMGLACGELRSDTSRSTDGRHNDDIDGEFDAVDVVSMQHVPADLSMWARRTRLALANERAREAYARLREAYARRREALAWHDSRIAALESARRDERPEPTLDGRQRIEDAYGDVIGAVAVFDSAFARESAEYERWSKGGIWPRFVGFFVRS